MSSAQLQCFVEARRGGVGRETAALIAGIGPEEARLTEAANDKGELADIGEPIDFRVHPAAAIFPLLTGEPFDALVADVAARGLIQPIVRLDGAILDGRNRLRACMAAGVEPRFEEYTGNDPLAFVVSTNLHRRHLSESQRAMVAARVANLGEGRPSETAPIEAVSQTAAATLLNVGRSAVQRAAVVQRDAVPELIAAVERDDIAVSVAADIARLPEPEQRLIDLNDKRAVLDAAKAIRTERADEKRAARTELLVNLSNRNAPLPDRRYPIIYADPPWQYDFSPSNDRAIENHYPTMPIEDILALDVASIATPDAMLFLWAPPSFIKKGLAVLEAWGFELATSLVWVKDRIGTGIYVRQRHEYLLLGKRGQPITPRPGSQPDSVIEAPRQEHSAKPPEAYALIERMYPNLPKIELFARAPRDGFDAWGNQAEAA